MVAECCFARFRMVIEILGEAGLLGDEEKIGNTSVGCALSSEARWYAIRTQARHEALAEANLRRQGFRVFIPKTLKNIKHARKIEARKVQLFPGYGFVALDLTREHWQSINGTFGVIQLIMAREQPIPVPLGVVEEILEFSDPEGIVDLSRGLAVGAEVQLRAGPFAGAIGLLCGLDDKGRVEVLLRIMNGEIRVKAAQELLEAHIPDEAHSFDAATKRAPVRSSRLTG